MKSYLQVKLVNLADEARYIRQKERKWKEKAAAARRREKDPRYAEANLFGLKQHRKTVVRIAARHTNIAYGFLRGRTYHEIEQLAYVQPNWEEIERMVKDYGEGDERERMQRYSAWLAAALGGHKIDKRWHDAVPGSVCVVTPWSEKAYKEMKERSKAVMPLVVLLMVPLMVPLMLLLMVR